MMSCLIIRRLVTRVGFAGALLFAVVVYADPPAYTAITLYPMAAPAGLTNLGPLSQTTMDTNGQVVGFGTRPFGGLEAVLWASDGTAINLNPANLGYEVSTALGVFGSQQVGYGSGTASAGNNHALMWSGSADSAQSLHPTNLAGYTQSRAFGTDGTNQVGFATAPNGQDHAIVWNGSASTAIDLHPTQPNGPLRSIAYAMEGNQQVGIVAGQLTSPNSKAALWSGSAASFIDLTPTHLPYSTFIAFGIGGGQQVGNGSKSGILHAILWSGTAASAIDLGPDTSNRSTARDTNGVRQVGFAEFPDPITANALAHAMVWSGTKESAFDLHMLLPTNLRASWANSINSANDIFGVAVDSLGTDHVVQWIAGPHSASVIVLAGADRSATVAGRSTETGNVQATFAQTDGGQLTSINSLLTAAELSAQTAAIDFALPSSAGLVQTWELTYSGSFAAPATLVFHYDSSFLAPGIDELDLQIEHFTGGQWVTILGVVDPGLNTITIQTDTFSPFALSIVPEPGVGAFLSIALLSAGLIRRRRQKSSIA